jgi:hypothetical protein
MRPRGLCAGGGKHLNHRVRNDKQPPAPGKMIVYPKVGGLPTITNG